MLPSLKLTLIIAILTVSFKSYGGKADFLAHNKLAIKTPHGDLQETTEALVAYYWKSLKPVLVIQIVHHGSSATTAQSVSVDQQSNMLISYMTKQQ